MRIQPFLFPLALVADLVLSGSFPAFASAQDDAADVVAKAEACVVRIEVENMGQGSGFVVDGSGIVITNVHVMAGANKATATFPNGKVCKITGSYLIDEGRDICVIQLDANNLPVLPMADNLPRKGEEVVALGSPLGLSFSATRGIVSAIRGEEEIRKELGDSSMKGTWVQVDTPLSPGNSGGPLINKTGKLVAMSTRASSGRAQNLNFGISVVDVKNAIAGAKGKPLVALASGVGKIDMDEIHPESGVFVERVPVPETAILEYVQEGRDSFDSLTKDIRREVAAQNDTLRAMKKGDVDSSFRNRIVRETSSGKFYFGSETLKKRAVKDQEERHDELTKIRDSIGRTVDNNSLFSLCWNYGPQLDPRDKGKVGFVNDAVVLHAMTEHDVVVLYENAPYLLWVKDAAGLSEGQPITPSPVYVVGSKTLVVPGQGTVAVTILNAVLETELRKAIFGEENAAAETKPTSDFRVWKDNTGKYDIDAKLIESDDKQVVLKKKDGSIVTVPFSKLSDEDLKFLGKPRK